MPAVQETQVQFGGSGEPLQKRMAIHSSVASRFPWMETSRELDTTERLSLFLKDPAKDGDGPGFSHCVQENVSV